MTYPRTYQPVHPSHDCKGDTCKTCGRRIEEAEYEADFGWLDMGDEMDARAEIEARHGW